ncbi:MAG: hypothetical protein U5L96_00735 [Owenweeksia sp.]|nr:hypothetical protein [Owenweeksia sp.]
MAVTTGHEQANSPNLLGSSITGSDDGGQAWYDLALAVNPTDKNEVSVGGVNIWKSTNGGVNWSLAARWYGGRGPHLCTLTSITLPTNPALICSMPAPMVAFIAMYRNQTKWDELNTGMNITQYYPHRSLCY